VTSDLQGGRIEPVRVQISHGGIIPTMILTMDAKRRLTVPAGLSAAQPGDAFDVIICLALAIIDALPFLSLQ
jgi:hypothetical protein